MKEQSVNNHYSLLLQFSGNAADSDETSLREETGMLNADKNTLAYHNVVL